MRNNKKTVRIIALVLAVLMVLTLFTGIFGILFAEGRSLADIDREINSARNQLSNLRNRTDQIQGEIEEISGLLGTLREQEDAYLEELSILQEQLYLLEEQIELTEEQIYIYQRLIADKEARLEDAIERETQQLEAYIQRVRAMEERGQLSYIQILLSARSFGDLVTRMHDAQAIVDSDQRMAEALERYRIAVGEFREELEEDRVQLEILIAQLEEEREILDRERTALQERIEEVEARIYAQEIAILELYAEEERIQAEILRRAQDLTDLDAARIEAIRELERQAAAGGNPGGGGMGGTPARPGTAHFVWPSDFTRNVTSGFGPRQSPGGIGSRFHQGIDIAAAGINGTNVIAAASGYVTFSGWSGGFGNFVMIRHGNIGGNVYYTAYAHNSANLVSRGQNVVQGQVIALVGTTGNSTGPHIHFEIIRNGVRIDPMIYF